MPSVECHRLKGRNCSLDQQSRKHTEHWQIKTNADGLAPYQAGELARKVGTPDKLPQRWDRHPADPAALLVSLNIEQDSDSPRFFKATATYDTSYDNTKQEENPLRRPPRYYLEPSNYDRVIEKDIKGRPILNTAGDPFDPPLTFDDCRQVLVVVKNFGNIFELAHLQRVYKDAVNTNPFYGAGPRQAKVMSITSGELQTENDVSYYAVAIRIAFAGEGETWDKEILSTGMRRLRKVKNDDGTYSYEAVPTDKKGNPIVTPIRLARDGTQLDDDAESVYVKYRVFPERDFRGLGI